jgi:predicted membrane chloride channel (bestrophin family)
MPKFKDKLKNKFKRSTTGNHVLEEHHDSEYDAIPHVPTYTLISWTLGRGSVIWRIWAAVLLHTVFAALVVTLSMQKILNLKIPNVMLTVLGVVIGFVISYRAMSGYDRYWMGRSYWSDVIRNSRTLGRLIWFHVPPLLTVKTPDEILTGKLQRTAEELNKVMAEKRMALDLIEGFAVALKHHIRGELGIYYEDLYNLIKPMHEHTHTADDAHAHHANSSAFAPPRRAQQITTKTTMNASVTPAHASTSSFGVSVVAPVNEYGTFDSNRLSTEPNSFSTVHPQHVLKRTSSHSSNLSSASEHQELLPSSQPQKTGILDTVSADLVPFAGALASLKQQFVAPPLEVLPPGITTPPRKWQGPVHSGLNTKHPHPEIAAEGENLPLEILRCLSEWCSVLEDRNTVPGTSLGSIIGTLAAFEDSLSALERILTTPLPFVYSVHIRHTVWVYLFFLPFQLVDDFGYYTIPGVAIAAFIYLGFIAAGEEIEQPFGYDDNDLDLDLFCDSIIIPDIQQLKRSPCLNAYFPPQAKPKRPVPQRSKTVTEIADFQDIETHGREAHLF